MKTEIRHFSSLLDLQAFIAALQTAKKSYKTAKNARPKPGKWLYEVRIYDAT